MTFIEPITPKEEAFCRALVLEGLGPADAYRASRDASRMANTSIHSNAKKILRRPRVKARIEELQRQKAEWESPIHLQSPTRACARAGAHPRESPGGSLRRESKTSSSQMISKTAE
jgi:hypothetical protein